MRGTLVTSVAALFAVVAGAPAEAGCRFDSATTLHFEPYLAWRAEPTLGTGTIVVSCGDATTIMITVGPGRSGDAVHRTMTAQGKSRLAYNLFADPQHEHIWGDGLGGIAPTFAIPSGYRSVRIPIYGAIAPHQNADSGTYGDDPFVTISF